MFLLCKALASGRLHQGLAQCDPQSPPDLTCLAAGSRKQLNYPASNSSAEKKGS